MQIMKRLKGFYWYFSYNKRIIIPMTKDGWTTLFAVADSWSDGFPRPMEYGSYCLISFEAVMSETQMNALDELLEYQRKHTQDYLAAYSVFPIRPWVKIERAAEEHCYKSIGWRQEFEWRPTC